MTTPTNDETCAASAGTIRVITCYMINCADCDDDCWEEDEYTPHFASEAELYKRLLRDGWTHDRHGRWLCPRCTAQADCDRDGHQWGEWKPYFRDIEVVWRWCDHCGDSEDSLAALLPNPDRTALVTTCKEDTPTGRVLAVLRDTDRTGDEMTAADVAMWSGLDRHLVVNQLLRLRALGVVDVRRDLGIDTWRAA